MHNIRSILPDFKQTPEQVLKFMIYSQSKEIKELKQELHKADSTLYHTHNRCKHCKHWYHLDEEGPVTCQYCNDFHCKDCIEILGLSYENCEKCDNLCCVYCLDDNNLCGHCP